jgi:hypothetical protein
MNMNGLFPESNTFLLGLIHQDLQDGAKTSDRVNTVDCEDLAVVLVLAAASAATAAEQVTVTLSAFAANSGGSGTVITFSDVWVEAGTTLAATDGNPVRTQYGTAQSSYTTPAADGTKQMIVTIPIRSRQMPKGLPWLEAVITGPTEARLGGVYFIRSGEQTGPVRSFSLL